MMSRPSVFDEMNCFITCALILIMLNQLLQLLC